MYSVFRLLLLAFVVVDSQQNSLLCGEKNYTFCWWAVDIIAVSLKPELYRNGNSSVIENNIKRICSESNHSRYGISYVNITESTYHSPIDILVEVSYYCCKNCTVYEKYSEKRIIEDLLDHYYKKRLEPLHDTDRYCFNIEGDKQKNIVDDAPCILMLNANNEMKIYSGPMLWNQISQSIVRGNEYFNPLAYLYQNGYGCNENNMSTVEDEQCRKLVLKYSYFAFCCCWNNPFNCTYSPKTKLITEQNKEIWLNLAKTRNPASTLQMESIAFGNKYIEWSYRVFIYSFPEISKGTDTIPGMNEPRYYCFQPQPSMDDDLNYWTTVKLEEIQSRYRFCKFTFTVHFQNNKLERMLYKIEPDSNEMCEAALCSHTYPKCLNDLFLQSNTTLIQTSCCCKDDLCSQWEQRRGLLHRKRYFLCHHQLSAYLRMGSFEAADCVRSFEFQFQREIFLNEYDLIGYKFTEQTVLNSDRKKLTCTIYHTHPLKDPYCYLNKSSESERIAFQHYNCKCDTANASRKAEKCDVETHAQLFSSKNWSRPTCYFTSRSSHYPLYIFGKDLPPDNFQKVSKQETIETPICVMALLISNFGLFYRFHTFHYSHFQFQNEIATKRFSVTKEKYYSTYTTLCRSNRTIPCNNGLDLINHLATYAVHVHSKRKIPQFYQRCSVFGDLERKEKCSSTWGCYTFTYLDARKKLTGCVDQIPALVEVIPNLSPLAWCLQIPHRESKYKCRAYKGATNLITSGTLCCCQKDCSIMIDNGEYGYNSFESVYAG
ncbi:CCA-adding enzyme [Dirofilaria immitis]